MKYPDTVQLATVTSDGYGDKTATVLAQTNAAFIERTALDHALNADNITSDAAVYLDPTNAVVNAKITMLEGTYVLSNQQWYCVKHVVIARRKLLNNAIDNIYCLLEKESGIAYATYVS